MHAPPFRLARTAGLPSSGGVSPADAGRIDACCAPSRAQQAELKRRTRLSELDSNLHCSIIGTCLSTHELRKLVPKFTLFGVGLPNVKVGFTAGVTLFDAPDSAPSPFPLVP